MRKTEDIVFYDFQGWPEYKMNLREILLALGGQQDGDFIKFASDALSHRSFLFSLLLHSYPHN